MIGDKNRDSPIRRRAGSSQRWVIPIFCTILFFTIKSFRMSLLDQYLSPVTSEGETFLLAQQRKLQGQIQRTVSHDLKEQDDSHSDKKGNSTYNMLVVVPGIGDFKRIQVVTKSLNAISSSLESKGFGFSCIVYVWNTTIVKDVSDALKQCSVTNNAGKWTHQMLKVPLPSKNTTHVALLLDDVDSSSIDVADFLTTMSRAKYDKASASTPEWHYSAMHQRPQCISHRTDFAVILFSVFTVDAWLCWQSQIDVHRNEYGWGYDVIFAEKCNSTVGVIDNAIARRDELCEKDGDCSRSNETQQARDQMWQWIIFAKNLTTQIEAKAYWKYVSEQRPNTFPTCDLAFPNTSFGQQDIRFRLVSDQYFKTVEHRGGWKSIIRYLVNSNDLLLNDEPGNDEPVLLVDIVENWFPYPKKATIFTKPWIGITHLPLNVPVLVNERNLKRTLSSFKFKKSLPYCLGLVVLSNDMVARVQQIVTQENNGTQLNICSMPHPIAVEEGAVRYDPDHDRHAQISGGGVLLLGQQYRRLATIHKIQTQRRKMWLPGMTDSYVLSKLEERQKHEIEYEGVQPSSVEMIYVSSYEEYDQLVKQNIVVIDLFAATANNAVLEAIALNAPFFVRRLPSTAQYLGEEYPLLFSDFYELQSMLDDEKGLPGLLLSGHEYLKRMDKKHLSLANFAANLRSCVKNASLLDLPEYVTPN